MIQKAADYTKTETKKRESQPFQVRIVDLPAPEKEETPEKARILSRQPSRFKGGPAEKKDQMSQDRETVIPTEVGGPIPLPSLPFPQVKESVPIALPSPLRDFPSPTENQTQSPPETKQSPEVAKPERAHDPELKPPLSSPNAKEKVKEKVAKKEPSKPSAPPQRETPNVEKNRQPEKNGEQVASLQPPLPDLQKPSPPPTLPKGLPLPDVLLPRGSDIQKFARLNNSTQETSDEATISLDTLDDRYFLYFQRVKELIESVWRYPHEAGERGIQGALRLRFTILEDGSLDNVMLINSSGYNILDDEAVRAVRVAAPYPPFPERFHLKKLNVNGTFIYRASLSNILVRRR